MNIIKNQKKHRAQDFGLRGRFEIIKNRCVSKHFPMCSYYKDKGIKCLWNSYEDFKNDMYESYLNHLKENGAKQTTLDRINNNGNYCKENCRWATYKEQILNRKKYDKRICKLCKKSFSPNSTRQKFCGNWVNKTGCSLKNKIKITKIYQLTHKKHE